MSEFTAETITAPSPGAYTHDYVPGGTPSTIISERGEDVRPTSDAGFEDDTPPQPETDPRRSAVAKAFDDVAKPEKVEPVKDAKADEAPKVDKARAEDGKFAAKVDVKGTQDHGKPLPIEGVQSVAEKPATGQAEDGDKRPSEGRQFAEPPARFLPEAKKVWANVPNAVKADFHRLMAETETETARIKQEATAEWEPVRKYADMAKQSGTTLDKALEAYVTAEQQLRSNDPATKVAAINRIIQTAGIDPRQYAAFITNNPNAAVTQAAPQPAQQQNVPDPQIKQLEDRLASFESQMAAQKVEPIITAFAEKHTDYYALQEPIAKVLQSGIIEQLYGAGLTPAQKLETAYQMAGGSPPSHQADLAPADHFAPAPRPVDLDGTKSIKGAPNSGTSTEGQSRGKESPEETVRRAMSALGK